MKINIEIECDTIGELLTHLFVIKNQVRSAQKKLKLDSACDEFPDNIDLSDDNCYGFHQLTLKNE